MFSSNFDDNRFLCYLIAILFVFFLFSSIGIINIILVILFLSVILGLSFTKAITDTIGDAIHYTADTIQSSNSSTNN
jgi:hypothetical protein